MKKLILCLMLSVMVVAGFMPQSFADADINDADNATNSNDCTCTALCSDENVNEDCAVCGEEDADLSNCKGEQQGEEEDQAASNSNDDKTLGNTLGNTLKTQAVGTLSTVYLDGESGDDDNDGTAATTSGTVGPVKTFAKAKSLLASGGTIYIVGTVTVSGTGNEWSLDSDDYGDAVVKRGTSFNKEMVILADSASLKLSDITIDGGSRSVSGGSTASIIKMTKATLTLGDGAVLQNNYNTRSGGGVHASDDSTVTMQTGSKIENCGTWTNLFVGGGVALYNSTMNMTGGTITNCRANKGGGVSVIASTFNMSGGEISECELYDYGDKSDTNLPNPGYTNTTNAFGCGVLLSNGLAGGTATTSPASTYNGTFATSTGVQNFTEGKAYFNMSGGTLKNNGVKDFASFTASQQPIGGGICAMPHNMSNYLETKSDNDESASLFVNISGTANITGNGAAWGGGIACFFTASQLTMTGGTISGNQAYNDGGGIYLATRNENRYSSVYNSWNPRPVNTISGGTIKDNHAGGYFTASKYTVNKYGGGIALDGWTNGGNSISGGATLTISGKAKVDANTAVYGGGISCENSSKLTVEGGDITNNKADMWNADEMGIASGFWLRSGKGAGIYSSTSVYIYGGNISGNEVHNNKFAITTTKTASYSNGVWCGGIIYMHGSPTFGEDDDLAFYGYYYTSGMTEVKNYYIYIDGKYTPGETPVSVTTIYYNIRTPYYSDRSVEIIDSAAKSYQLGTMVVYYSEDAGDPTTLTAEADANGYFVPSDAMQDPSDASTYTSRAENSDPVVIGQSKLYGYKDSSGTLVRPALVYFQGIQVTYKANETQGGTGQDVVKLYKAGSTPKALANDPSSTSDDVTKFTNTNARHTFTGWNTVDQPTMQNEGTAYTAGTALQALTQDITLYAQWEEDENYLLTYETNGGTDVVDKDGNEVKDSSGNPNKEKYYKNDIANLTERITKKTDREFTGWYLDKDLEQYIPTQQLEIEGNTTVYAGWGFKVNFDPNGGSMTKPSDPTAVDNGDGTYTLLINEGKKVTEPDTPTRDGYTFLGWYTAKDGGEKWDFSKGVPTGEMTLYAHWKANGSADKDKAKTPVISKVQTPKSGDSTNTDLWAVLALIGIAGMLFAAASIKRRKGMRR